MKIGPWQVLDGYCAVRVKIGGNINNVADRYAFIEKTPRIRIRLFGSNVSSNESEKDKRFVDWLNWAEGHCGNDEYGFNQKARDWCDLALKTFGHELED